MIIGIGVDTTEIERVAPAMAAKILTPAELAQYQARLGIRKSEYLAGRWAAKEAASKALGCGFGEQLVFTDIEILNTQNGQPELTVKGYESLRFHVSITHTKTVATAFVVAEE